jgi:hypothetical protein
MIRGPRKAKTAEIAQVLIFYDEPQLVLLKTNKNNDFIAVAVDRDGLELGFFGCEIRDRNLSSYLAGKADLLFLFQNAVGDHYYFFDLTKADGKSVELEIASPQEASNAAYWPQAGVFSRSHTSAYRKSNASKATERFLIDGTWGANDFSHFHGKLSDLYAFVGAARRLAGKFAKQEFDYISGAIKSRLWQGGGSYVAFYDDLVNKVQAISPLEISKIQYASPGEIIFRGDASLFKDVREVMDAFRDNRRELHALYVSIHGALSKASLLRASRTSRVPRAIADTIFKECSALASGMNVDGVDTLYDACDRDLLTFAKVVMSMYRRADDLYSFQAEGRVTEPGSPNRANLSNS